MSNFLGVPPEQWLASNEWAFAIPDGFPVSPGHTLVVTRRVVPTWFEASADEKAAIFDLVEVVKRLLDAREPKPDGYNVGFNAGAAAGQTVMHLHVHVIPRYRGDMDDPRGGVRHVIPSKGNYLLTSPGPEAPGSSRRRPRGLVTGGTSDPFVAHLAPLLRQACEVAIVAAFVQESGLRVMEHALRSAVHRGASVRLLTGDYLEITQAEALEQLIAWQALWSAPELTDEEEVGSASPGGRLEIRVVETERLPAPTRSFHPKSWRIEGDGLAVAFVGSSNLSSSALRTGIEWNLRLEQERDPVAYDEIAAAFDALWRDATILTPAWVDAYKRRLPRETTQLPPGEVEPEPQSAPPTPHPIQVAALEALSQCRSDHRERALVVMATGLGKTWLAALDAEQYLRLHHQTAPRILVIAHRAELLAQAADAFRVMLRRLLGQPCRVSWFAGDRAELDGHLVLASVQKLSRKEHTTRLAGVRFDYVVIDEAHHADAPSYRRIVAALDAAFILGLTATPDRADDGEILDLLDDHIAYQANLAVGIRAGLLVPFAYWGLKDDIDYRAIPWRSGRFDLTALEPQVANDGRMAKLWEAWQAHRGSRTIVFCCSIAHADFASRWLEARGVRAAAVHSGPTSADREAALRDLSAGDLEALCAVDLFNEGIDVPRVDRVVMLRPTESRVVFLQQLGRGLRRVDGKDALTVIDFVGNHRIFLDRVRFLLDLGPAPRGLPSLVAARGRVEVLPGCTIDIELEAIDLLRRMTSGRGSEIEIAYEELAVRYGRRPMPTDLFWLGHDLRGLKETWFAFAARQSGPGALSDAERRTYEEGREWFDELEKTELQKSFKLVVLQVLLDADALQAGLPLDELARRSRSAILRSPELLPDLFEGGKPVKALGGDPRACDERTWLSYWRGNPIQAWTGKKKGRRTWFGVEGDRFVPMLPATDDPKTFAAMTQELVAYRFARYRRSRARESASLEARSRGAPTPRAATAVGDGDAAMAPILLASIRAYPSLAAAAGPARGRSGAPEEEIVRLPVEASANAFAVRVAGDSMVGGKTPMRSGDWAVLRGADRLPLDAVTGQIALIELPGVGEDRYQLKRVVATSEGLRLRSEGRAVGADEPVPPDAVALATLIGAVRPEDVLGGTPVGAAADEAAIAAAFGVEPPLRTGRHGGHLLLCVETRGVFVAPDRLVHRVRDAHPAETAFVFARRPGGSWRYCGVAHRLGEHDDLWSLPPLDRETWDALRRE